jgi:membrane protease YdiL (CAAX protease family)
MGDLVIGVPAGCLLKLLQKSVAMPLIGAEATNPAYHYLVGNAAALPGILLMVIVGGGFAEETVYRGYLFERLGKLLGTGIGAKGLIVLVTAGLFALAHYPEQGFPGAQQALMTGAVFGTIFAATGRIWLLMCMHVAYDLVAVAIIYWNLEAAVAHFIFN